jgi:predicted nucleotidyltransferase
VTELRIDLLLKELADRDVEFLVIGGVAVGWHGYIRATKDLDVVPNPDPENLSRLAALLVEVDTRVAGAGDFNPDELLDPTDPDALALGGNWVLETSLGRFDVLQSLNDRDLWETLAPEAIETEIDGVAVKVCSYGDLLGLKREAGRDDDLRDIERLERARRDSQTP